MQVQEADFCDIPSLCILLNTLFSKEIEFIPDFETQKNGLELILNNEQMGKLFVLKDDDKVIGMVNLLFTISTALGGKVALLEDMVVDPLWHNQGGGTMLLGYAIAYAQKFTCKRITLQSDADNVAAHRFYKRFGFEYSGMKTLKLHLAKEEL